MSRAAAIVGTTTASGWTASTVASAWREYLGEMTTYSAAARLIAGAVPAQVNTVGAANHPVRIGGAKLIGFVDEAAPIAVVSGGFANVEIGPAKKFSHIITWSRELDRRSDARAIFLQMLREDVAATLDTAMLSTTAATTAIPAGLLNGVTPLVGYAGGNIDALRSDLIDIATAVATGGSGAWVAIMAPERAVRLRILAPELAATLDIATSASVPANRIIAADAGALIVGIDEAPETYITDLATIHMSDTPVPIVSSTGPVTADPVRSLWQTGSIGARVLHDLAFAKRRSNAVAYLDGATW